MQNNSDTHLRLDKQRIRHAFDSAVQSYDESAVLQREIADRLLEKLEYIKHAPHQIADIGAGTGYCTHALMQRYRKARVLALDLSVNMLRMTQQKLPIYYKGPLKRFSRITPVCADAERLPLADASVDMLFSNLALQWCNDISQTFAEFRRVLRPGGMLLFSTFGPDTLHELRSSWSVADGYPHVSEFADMHDIGDAMLQAGLADPVVDMERITLTYHAVRDLMHDLKAIGAHNASHDRNRALTGKGQLQAMLNAYEKFRTDEGVLPATYEVVYGHAWAGTGAGSVCMQPGAAAARQEVCISPNSIGQRGA